MVGKAIMASRASGIVVRPVRLSARARHVHASVRTEASGGWQARRRTGGVLMPYAPLTIGVRLTGPYEQFIN